MSGTTTLKQNCWMLDSSNRWDQPLTDPPRLLRAMQNVDPFEPAYFAMNKRTFSITYNPDFSGEAFLNFIDGDGNDQDAPGTS